MVRCVYLKKESIGVDHIRKAQQDGAFYHSDEIWCVTPTDFTNMAIKESRSEDSEVRLIDGKELYEEYISEFEKRDE